MCVYIYLYIYTYIVYTSLQVPIDMNAGMTLSKMENIQPLTVARMNLTFRAVGFQSLSCDQFSSFQALLGLLQMHRRFLES